MIRTGLKAAIGKSGLIVKELAAMSGVNKRTLDKWIGSAETEPRTKDLYKVCVTLGITMEEIVNGEEGLAYTHSLVAREGKLWEAPERLRSIVKTLETLDKPTLQTVEKMVSGLKKR